jgi:hypothetical protein
MILNKNKFISLFLEYFFKYIIIKFFIMKFASSSDASYYISLKKVSNIIFWIEWKENKIIIFLHFYSI